MKIQILMDEPQIQASFTYFKNKDMGGLFTVYFHSGERYEHETRLWGYSPNQAEFVITDYDDNQKGIINLQANEPFFTKHHVLHTRNKESDYFYLINNTFLLTDSKTFFYEKTF